MTLTNSMSMVDNLYGKIGRIIWAQRSGLIELHTLFMGSNWMAVWTSNSGNGPSINWFNSLSAVPMTIIITWAQGMPFSWAHCTLPRKVCRTGSDSPWIQTQSRRLNLSPIWKGPFAMHHLLAIWIFSLWDIILSHILLYLYILYL